MINRIKSLAVLGVIAVLLVSSAWAAAPRAATTVTVEKMHCAGCAKKLVTQLKRIPGVASVKADFKKRIAVIVPKNVQQIPSPRVQWEAVEKAGFKPVKMVGPLGTFTKKPGA